MTDSSSTITKDPSLKRYFKYMLTNRKMSVQFTSRKIREIIEKDLNILFDSHNSLYARICTEAFAYYMQSWPEWNIAIKSVYSDALYECLITYLRNKLLYLKKRELIYAQTNKDKEKCQISMPANVNVLLPNKGKKVKSPYTLRIKIPAQMWNTHTVSFQSDTNLNDLTRLSDNLILEFNKDLPKKMDLDLKDLINYPFVSVEFKVPGLINIQRANPFKIERYIHSCDDLPSNENNFVISVEHVSSKAKVYTYEVMEAFFKELNAVLFHFSDKICKQRRQEVAVVCAAFLDDIKETNICNNTVCEEAVVNYNISNSTYCANSVIDFKSRKGKDNLVYKKIITPVAIYNLAYFSLLQQDITPEGFTYFKFINDNDKVYETAFLHYIGNSVKYKCCICNLYYTIHGLKSHMLEVHPLDPEMLCTKCNITNISSTLLASRWHHRCI